MATGINRYGSNGMTRLPDLVDRLFQESFVIPSALDRAGGTDRAGFGVNLYESGDTYVLEAALPGLAAESIDIQVMGREVTVKGSVATSAPENAAWLWRGFGGGDVQESFSLPVEIQNDAVEASYNNGILSLTLPKAEHLRARSIKVSVK